MSYAMTALAGACLGAFSLERDGSAKVAFGFGVPIFALSAAICAANGL